MKKQLLISIMALHGAVFAMDSTGKRLEGDARTFYTDINKIPGMVSADQMQEAYKSYPDLPSWRTVGKKPLLHVFITANNTEVVGWFLEHGANPDVTYKGKTAKTLACGNEQMLKLLASFERDKAEKDKDEKSGAWLFPGLLFNKVTLVPVGFMVAYVVHRAYRRYKSLDAS